MPATPAPPLPDTVVVGVDVGAASDHALQVAAALCRATGAALHLAHVKLTSPVLRGDAMGAAQRDRLAEEGEALLADRAGRVADTGGVVAATHVRFARRIEDGLVDLQHELGAALVVVGATSSGDVARRVIGALGPAHAGHPSADVYVPRVPARR